MGDVFPYANIVAGILILIVGFGFHWVGQLISIMNWDFAAKIGLQDKTAPPEYKIYEHGIAVADVAIGWIYGVAGIGLLLGKSWSLQLAWVPGVVLIYHGMSFWFWTRNQIASGHKLYSVGMRIAWVLVNCTTGGLAILVAWNGA